MSLKSRHVLVSCVLGVSLLVGPGRVGAEFSFSYTGTFNRATGNDNAGIDGANFTLTAEFPATPYVDQGDGQPVLVAESTALTITGAPMPQWDGDYDLAHELLMFPGLGGAMATRGTPLPLQFVRIVDEDQLRLNPNLADLFGGAGDAATIGQTPRLADFPTSISAPTMRALPHNIVYDVTTPSITTIGPSAAIPFFEDFESETEPADPPGFTENYSAFEKWDVFGTGVDLIARRFFPDQGIVVDLDGSSGSTLVTNQEFDLSPGLYQLSFELGGPFGGTPEDTILAALGDAFIELITIDRGAPFETFVREITINEPTRGRLSFTDFGADSNGALLDNVKLSFLSEIVGPLLGDIDSDGMLTVEDLDQLTDAIRQGLTDSIFDVNDDGIVTLADRVSWITDIRRTVFGDANLDGEFNSADLLQLFQTGEYEDGVPGNSTWGEGDFGGDFEFDSDDLILALQTGAYGQGPVAASPIPEPTSFLFVLAGLAAIGLHCRRQIRSQCGADRVRL